MKLADALGEYVNSDITMGTSNKRILLRESLERVRKRNELYFILCAGFLVVMFVVAIAIIVRHAGESVAWAGTSAAFGVSLAGMVRMMLGLWREKVATDMLLDLSGLDDGVLKEVSRVLLKRLRGAGPSKDK